MKKSTCLLICLFLGLVTLCGCKKEDTPEQSYSKYFGTNSGCKDLSLKEAFNLSAVWYFEKVANEIGEKKLAEFVNKISYGNKDASAEIPFWLDSSLKISPKEQVSFLKNLFEYKLGIDNRHIETLKQIMRKDSINEGMLYGKTGTSGNGNNGWFVGFYEKDNEKTYFAINLSKGENVSGKQAEKIAKNIIANCF